MPLLMGLGSVTFAHSLSVNHPPLRQAQVPVFVSFVSLPPIYAYYSLSCCLPHPDWLCLSALFPQKPSSSLWGSGVGSTRHVHPLDMSRALFLKKPIPKVLWVLDPALPLCAKSLPIHSVLNEEPLGAGALALAGLALPSEP